MKIDSANITLALLLAAGGCSSSSKHTTDDAVETARAGAGADATKEPTTAATQVPCNVASVISDNCTGCHAGTPKFGAPMPLMTQADFQAASKIDPSRKIYEVIPERVDATDITRRMPPASAATLNSTDHDALTDWVGGGAKATKYGCAISEKAVKAPPETTDDTATSEPGFGGASSDAREYDDPELKCYEFRAHIAGDKTAPYSVGTTPDMYTNFTFMPPWEGMQYARSFTVLDGNAAVIHHWLFYKNSAAGEDGAVGGSSGAHPNGELIHGWAPGGSNLYLDPDVGLEMPSNVAYQLETHHNNTSGAPQDDNSGIQVCVTPNAPKHVASLSWLGTDAINGTTASGTCVPRSTEPIQIIGVQPHMHLKGRHLTAEITRKSGDKEMLHDEPFDFNYQHSYHARTTLMPGDSIKTTCTYSEPATFGEGTNDEMCYAFTLYYPKFSLTNGNLISGLIHGPNTCLQ
jgi:hypothetical protein